jgi:non-specific serine/threonine protein kinase/serine/threonine-protein kinase
MNTERWEKVKSLLDAALPLDSGQRQKYLHEVCAGDDDLRFEVESLLISHEQAGNEFLKIPVFDVHAQKASRVGRRLGPYNIIEEIGHGGMGEVYRAIRADGQYTKEVAIKLVRGGLDSASVLQRFRNERQILASLDHPNIARLLDGGTTEDGIPYLVMELVEGVSIDSYCDQRRLNITQRLQLFRDVCAAVQYAHQRLVIHRDIKPGNILVAEGIPKLLDFGIAKILDPSVRAETTLAHPMTPEYASPEQIRGETVTTAADVYSLGVVLYQILTGRSPYPGDTRLSHDLARAICESEPERPSSVILKPEAAQHDGEIAQLTPAAVSGTREGSTAKLRRRLRGDLDNIVLKALRKEPQCRYASVEQFAEDIRRHLDDLPVTARKGSWSYHGAKFIERHRAAMAVTAIMVVTLIAGVILIVREARIARANGQRAEKRFNDVRKLANSLMFELHDSIKDLPGSTPARKLLVSRALEYLDSLSQEAKGDPSLQRELATAYQRIGDVQGQPRQANLGDQAGAAASYRKAVSIQESLLAADPRNQEVRREIVRSYGKLSDLLRDMGDTAGSVENSRKEMTAAEAVYAADPGNPENRLLFATYRMDFGYKQAVVAGDKAAGLRNLQQGSKMLEQIVAEHPENRYARRILGLSYSRTAEIVRVNPDAWPEALALYAKALAIKKALAQQDPNNTDYRRLVAYDEFTMANLMADLNDAKGALSLEREALASFQQLAAADPANAQFQQDIAELRADMGATLIKLGDLAGAQEQLKISLASAEKMKGAENPQLTPGRIVAMDEFRLGKVYFLMASAKAASARQRAEDCRQAEQWLQKSLPVVEFLKDHPTPGQDDAGWLAEIQHAMADCRGRNQTP